MAREPAAEESANEIKEADREVLRDWIRQGIARSKEFKSPTGLARKVGVATSTITNFLNKPDYKFTPNTTTITAIEKALKSRAPKIAGFEEEPAPYMPEAEEIDVSTLPKGLQGAIRALQAETKGLEVWLLHSDHLAARWKYNPGDYVLVDTMSYIYAGELVLAIKDASIPLFRVYHKPWLVSDQDEPLGVDDRRVIVKGKPVGRITWSG